MASYVVPSPVPQTPSIHYISPEPDNPPVLQASLYLFQTVAPPFCTSYLVTLLPEPVIEHFPATFPTHAASSQGLETHPVLDFLGQVLMNSLLYSLLCKTLFSWESVDGGFFFYHITHLSININKQNSKSWVHTSISGVCCLYQKDIYYFSERRNMKMVNCLQASRASPLLGTPQFNRSK